MCGGHGLAGRSPLTHRPQIHMFFTQPTPSQGAIVGHWRLHICFHFIFLNLNPTWLQTLNPIPGLDGTQSVSPIMLWKV